MMKLQRMSRVGLVLTFLSAAGACGGDDDQPAAPDAAVPDADPWDEATVERRWLREGFGEPMALAVGDLDQDGHEDIVLGGRGISLVDANARATHHPRWSVDWANDPANIYSGGDNQWVYAMSLTDITGDGVPDVLASSSAKDGYLVDGATGGVVWRVPWEGEHHSTHLALLSADEDGISDVFPTGGRAAYSGATGARLWQADLPGFAVFARSAVLTGYYGRDLLVTTELDAGVGGAPPTPGTRNAVFALSSAGEILWSADVAGSPTGLAVGDLDGDLIDEAIVITADGWLYAIGAGGTLFSMHLDGFPTAVFAADVDFDGFPEIFVGVSGVTDEDPWRVVALDATGATRWSEPVGGQVTTITAEQLDDDFELELPRRRGHARAAARACVRPRDRRGRHGAGPLVDRDRAPGGELRGRLDRSAPGRAHRRVRRRAPRGRTGDGHARLDVHLGWVRVRGRGRRSRRGWTRRGRERRRSRERRGERAG